MAVGKTEEELKAEGIAHKKGTFPFMAQLARARQRGCRGPRQVSRRDEKSGPASSRPTCVDRISGTTCSWSALAVSPTSRPLDTFALPPWSPPRFLRPDLRPRVPAGRGSIWSIASNAVEIDRRGRACVGEERLWQDSTGQNVLSSPPTMLIMAFKEAAMLPSLRQADPL